MITKSNKTADTNSATEHVDLKIIGIKGQFMQDMVRAKVLIPPGFIITSIFEKFMQETRLRAKIEATMTIIKPSLKNIDSILRVSSEMIKLIDATSFPKNLEQSILNEFAKLKTDYVAIRHSLILEGELSVFLTKELAPRLNIDKKNLIEAIKQSWASFFSPVAITYRLEKGMKITEPFSALLIQKMVEADVSGVCFTTHPLTQVSTQIFIEARFGLSGVQTTQETGKDVYIVNKKDNQIVGTTFTPQTTMITRVGSTTKEIEVGAVDSGNRKLTSKQIIILAKIAKRIEDYYGGAPQRIEWALEKDNFYILEAQEIEV